MELPRRRKSDYRSTDSVYRRFGAVAVRRGFVMPDQVKQAMSEQLDDDLTGRDHRLLGAILQDRGWISAEQIELVLADLRAPR
jgi:hypothetical protein